MELFVEDAHIHNIRESRIGNAHLRLHLNPKRQFHDAGEHARFIRAVLKLSLLHVVGHLHSVRWHIVYARVELNFCAVTLREGPLCS